MGILDFLFGHSQPAPAPQQQPQGLLGGGSAQSYRDYVIDMQSQGKQPLSMADWQKQQVPPPPKK